MPRHQESNLPRQQNVSRERKKRLTGTTNFTCSVTLLHSVRTKERKIPSGKAKKTGPASSGTA